MNHQPYENWILDNPSLTTEQKRELAQHLTDCSECSRIAEGWKSIERSIKSSQVIPAPTNFTQKWNQNLARRHREQEKKQARTLIITLSSVAAAIMIALGGILLPDFSFISLTVVLISAVMEVVNCIANFWMILFKLVQAVPPTTLLVTLVVVSGWVLLACFTLGLSIWKLAFRKGIPNK